MKKSVFKPVAVLCCAAMLLQGCGWIEKHQKTLIGVGVGTAGGAALGYMVRGKKGAVAGALVGALAGGVIGHMMERRERDAAATNQAYNYAPTQGARIEVSAAKAIPATVAPGGKVTLETTYAVMAPNAQAQLALVETRTVMFGSTKVAELVSNVNRVPGTYTTQVPIELKADTPKGQYQYIITVTGAGASGQQATTFVVQ